MKKFQKILLVVFSVFLMLALAIVLYGWYLKPTYEGELQLRKIDHKVTVHFDEYGVPHIYANSQKDALTALGYVHAQDRLWQMELMRRIAPGRLSEIFGKVMLPNDKLFAGLGIEEASEKAIADLDTNSAAYQLAQAYLEGVNQYIDQGKTPIEFLLLGVQKEKFTLKDVYNIFGYMSFSFAMAQKTDPLLTDLRDQLGMEYLKDFGLDGSLNTTPIKNYPGKAAEYAQMARAMALVLDQSPVPAFIGSNSWVIGGEKTKSGKVIFANDPHIGFSQPCTWYEAHIVTPDYEMYGFYLAGTPFPLLGHNREYAYGLTMFENDDIDLFREENHPSDSMQYTTAKGFDRYTVRTKTIKVKDSSDVVLKIKATQHGPIMNDILLGLKSNNPIAFSWIYTQQPIQILEAVYQLSHSKNSSDFHQAVGLIAAPGLNVMYGDAKGNIGWFASGKLYKQPESVNPNFILDGTNGIDDKKEFLEFAKNPSALNPSWHYVYSANNQPEAIDGYLYPGYYLPKDRAQRITDLLAPKNEWAKEDVCRMLSDNVSATAVATVAAMTQAMEGKPLSANEKAAIAVLKNWHGSNNANEVAPTIYNKWLYFYLKNTFEDEMGLANFNLFLGTHILKQVLSSQIQNDNSPWWDNRRTANHVETRAEILGKSFSEAIVSLEKQLGASVNTWTWNRVHVLEHPHPIGKVAVLRRFFNVGPFEVGGANEVINNQMFTYSDEEKYTIKAGPSTRRVIDFSDVENSVGILPTGQSGNQLSKHYNDQAEMYNQGKFRKMKLNKEEIVHTSSTLVFKP